MSYRSLHPLRPPGSYQLLGALLLCAAMAAEAHRGHDAHDALELEQAAVLAPGYRSLAFTPPPAGSYALPPLYPAADGQLLDANGKPVRLHDLLRDKYVLLSFIYTACNDVNGCPLAGYVLGQTLKRIAGEAELKDQLRLISISFDPQADTPAVMQRYREQLNPDGHDWRFLTTQSVRELRPLLASYDQSISRELDADGNQINTIAHILRVFLLDKNSTVRNIYSVSFLHADTIINDLKTLQLQEAAAADTRTQ